MRQVRGIRVWWGMVALAGGVWACETARNPGGVQLDLVPPTITLTTSGTSVPDTVAIAGGLHFTVSASYNLGLKDI